MRIRNRLQAAFFLLAFGLSLVAPAQELPAPVAVALNRAQIPTAAAGVFVQEAGGGPALVALNESQPFNPASTMKLVTSNAALEILGPAYVWKTQAYAEGRMDGDVLHGDLIIKGSGDPKLVLESLWMFLRRLRAAGIREIRGNLVLDRTVFAEVAHDAAQFDGDPLRPYNVGPDGLLLNYKSLSFRFAPDEARGAVSVTVDPPLAAYPLYAPVLSGGDCGDWRLRLNAAIDSNSARFNGAYAASCGVRFWHVHPHLMSHTQYFDLAFRRFWADLGGTLKGLTAPGILPPTARLVAEWDSATLSEIIRDINKFSNNVMARQLLLTLAAQVTKQPASTARGADIVRSWLANKAIEAPELVIENGSGLSRIERIAPRTMGRMLSAAFLSPNMPEFMASLPLVGHDGTMRSRLTTQTVAGKAHIKTGFLNDVRAIAGYVLAASGRRYVVVFMINHANALHGNEAQDALLQWVYERG
ncbi:MAG TPA: D-alanyl-D-alanine carboxypeptidase/D-alanyl-D-alanine-endopeptidase [Noviherbaspirillum sp.]|uniref:D-alanyl-D-alanine carboxypeptidase/D-alanyl-D-alanine endopeptidase n=1 Tax=Noviherbaspirillum sp. TaxID=1926288 RepID=UPI002D2FF393|nr:D-alanyl-D-alanine carboxypeptidase/D-alanyl-D-alanine-endopeptidase [Noviherbaspirillum sp.]HYD95060.1 D-alanyl-D-alanine carboxypeptidase/D-alanyl-D-alanine-endopeptidase [Noviherbaspirillum sp.]